MRVIIEYDSGTPLEIFFEFTETMDTPLMARIIDKVTQDANVTRDFTYTGKNEMSVNITYKGVTIDRVSVHGDCEVLRRIIALTVGNHFHMLKQEILHDMTNEEKTQ